MYFKLLSPDTLLVTSLLLLYHTTGLSGLGQPESTTAGSRQGATYEPSDKDNGEAADDAAGSRISNGLSANAGEFSSSAVLFYKGPSPDYIRCGAVFLTLRHLITSAHCIKEYDLGQITNMYIKPSHHETPEDFKLSVGGVCIARDFRPGKKIFTQDGDLFQIPHNDYAIIALDKRIDPTLHYYKLAGLPSDYNVTKFDQTQPYMTGMGLLKRGKENGEEPEYAKKLQFLPVQKVKCNETLFDEPGTSWECSTSANGGPGNMCFGDSGSGVYVTVPDKTGDSNGTRYKDVLVGVNSFGPTSCDYKSNFGHNYHTNVIKIEEEIKYLIEAETFGYDECEDLIFTPKETELTSHAQIYMNSSEGKQTTCSATVVSKFHLVTSANCLFGDGSTKFDPNSVTQAYVSSKTFADLRPKVVSICRPKNLTIPGADAPFNVNDLALVSTAHQLKVGHYDFLTSRAHLPSELKLVDAEANFISGFGVDVTLEQAHEGQFSMRRVPLDNIFCEEDPNKEDQTSKVWRCMGAKKTETGEIPKVSPGSGIFVKKMGNSQLKNVLVGVVHSSTAKEGDEFAYGKVYSTNVVQQEKLIRHLIRADSFGDDEYHSTNCMHLEANTSPDS